MPILRVTPIFGTNSASQVGRDYPPLRIPFPTLLAASRYADEHLLWYFRSWFNRDLGTMKVVHLGRILFSVLVGGVWGVFV